MTCDFCGGDLPVLAASNDRDALFDIAERIENEPGSHLCLDLNQYCIYEFYRTEAIQSPDGYEHLCMKCASRLDAFGSALLVRENHRRIMNYKNSATNELNKIRGKEMHPYMVAVDLGIKDRPVAQVCRKDGDRWVLTNTIRGDAVGHLMTYMEDSEYVK